MEIALEAAAYGYLGNVYQSKGYHRKVIEYHQKVLKIEIEIADRTQKGGAYGNLGNAYMSQNDVTW